MHQILSQSLKRWTYFVDDKCFTPLLYLLQIWIRFHTDSNFHCNFFNFASEKHNFSSAILVQISHILNFPFNNESFLQPCLPHLYSQIFNLVLPRSRKPLQNLKNRVKTSSCTICEPLSAQLLPLENSTAASAASIHSAPCITYLCADGAFAP